LKKVNGMWDENLFKKSYNWPIIFSIVLINFCY
jgi:hypothetical protein